MDHRILDFHQLKKETLSMSYLLSFYEEEKEMKSKFEVILTRNYLMKGVELLFQTYTFNYFFLSCISLSNLDLNFLSNKFVKKLKTTQFYIFFEFV